MLKMQSVPILNEKTGLVSYCYKNISDEDLKKIQEEVLAKQCVICTEKLLESVEKKYGKENSKFMKMELKEDI